MLLALSLCAIVLTLVFANLCLNLLSFPKLIPKKVPSEAGVEWPMVSILVPARNEEANIRRCIESLLSQNYPRFELIVLDDDSNDRTREILDQIKSHHTQGSKLRILEGKSLPEGWIGKCWACHQLAEAASSTWLLFTDADTWHHTGTLASALTMAEDERADVLSGWPRQLTETFGEQLVIPMVNMILLGYCPLWLINVVQSPKMIAACGQFMLWKSEAYRRVGGHEAVKAHLVEDVALAGHAMRHKLRLVNVDAGEVVSTRMYRNFRELWNGFAKNFYTGFGGHPLPFFIFLILQAGPFLFPWAALRLATGASAIDALISFAVLNTYAIALILFSLLIQALPAIRLKQIPLSVALYPISELLLLAIGLNSFFQTRSREGVEWKGRRIRTQGVEHKA